MGHMMCWPRTSSTQHRLLNKQGLSFCVYYRKIIIFLLKRVIVPSHFEGYSSELFCIETYVIFLVFLYTRLRFLPCSFFLSFFFLLFISSILMQGAGGYNFNIILHLPCITRNFFYT